MGPNVVLRQVKGGETTTDEFPVDSLIELTLGRDPACQIQFLDTDDAVSRRHARIAVAQRDPLEIALTDLSSRNGTFVNGKKVEGEVKLSSGDKVQLGAGGPTFEFEITGLAAETRVITPTIAETRVVVPQKKIEVNVPPRQKAAPGVPVPWLTRRNAMIGGLGLMSGGVLSLGGYALAKGKGALSYKVYHSRLIMSSCYKAYGNPEAAGGRYWFARVVLQNAGRGSVKNVKISYQIPGLIDWTTPDEAPELLPRQTAVFAYYPKFPAKLAEPSSRSPATLETKIEYDDGSGHQSHIEKREFEILGLTEFAYGSMAESEVVSRTDAENNNPLLASYVTDEDPAVKTFYAKIAEVSGGIGTGENQKDLMQFVKSTYEYMVRLGMTYSGAKGVPDSTGDVQTTVQSIRLPRDLIIGNSGLCIELAILWCALAQGSGLEALLTMIPGHAFPMLVAGDGTMVSVESTMIGGSFGGNLGKAGTWEDALKVGLKNWKDNQNKSTTDVLDIRDLQAKGIRPPELPPVDRPALVKMLDDRLNKRTPTKVVVIQRVEPRHCWWCKR